MKFSIITPTHKRANLLSRAVNSVLGQTYADWELIIVNDSPDDTSYTSLERNITDPRIIYLNNEQNMGVNFSRNRALNNVTKDANWVIFLDDDDYLAPDALATFRELITIHPNKKWFVTNRAYANGKPITNFPKSDTEYYYAWDYLILKRCKNDATHCINTSLVNNVRFSKTIKQAEEWFFFFQVGLKSEIFYHDHDSTFSDGYNEHSGLNFRSRSRAEQIKIIIKLTYESIRLNIFYHFTFLTYILVRFFRVLLTS